MKSNTAPEPSPTALDPSALEALWAAEDERSLSGDGSVEQQGGPTDTDGQPKVIPPPPPPGNS